MLGAVRRELREELRIDVVSVATETVAIRDGDSPFTIEFVETNIEGEPAAVEHEQITWVPIDRLGDYELAPADAVFASDHLAVGPNPATGQD